ncbi:Ca2+-binding RTX toxin-like protein [Sphingobium fontiphilum]|uniref:Ca2+-binding RTX toxin-like protein n=1 Tax=Sphingobium fontiphilum TaxID=944425 RepID=A0A7W6DI30_9SPHN|nr:Ca2+-binding RTX toxin-like protein [Sphingobium fontiphilum]
MSIQSVINSIKFWNGDNPPSGWIMNNAVKGSIYQSRDNNFELLFINYITNLYNSSPTMRNILDLVSNNPIYVAKHLTIPGQVWPSQVVDNVEYASFISLNFDAMENIGWFNKKGIWVESEPQLVIAHEFSHRYWQELQYDSPHDPSSLAEDQNDPNFDNDGDMVRFQNLIAAEIGITEKIRVSYYSAGLIDNFDLGESYTDYKEIDIVRISSPGIALDTSTRSDNSRDLLFGSEGNDSILSGSGDDFIYADSGDDVLDGGSGNDRLFGDLGDDVLIGRSGNDQMAGGDGDDNLDAGSGDDLLVGGIGSDLLFGGPGNDEIWGGELGEYSSSGYDIVSYFDSAKRIKFEFSSDVKKVHDGNGGMDLLYSINEIIGTPFRDYFTIVGHIPEDMEFLTLDANGGQGSNPRDSINILQSTSAMHIFIDEYGNGSILDAQTSGVIFLKNFHTSVIGSQQADTISDEASGEKHISGGGGNDIVTATGGAAFVDGGDGDDMITGGSGNDVLVGGMGSDILNGGAGSDHLIGSPSESFFYDELNGGDGHDYLAHGHFMEGGAGNDIIDARGVYQDPAHNYGAMIKFSAGDGHDTIIDDGSQTTPGTYNGEIIDPVDGVGKIDFGSLLTSDVNFIWDANFVLTGSSGGTSYYDAVGNLAVVISATGDSILFQNVAGNVISYNGVPTSGRILALGIGLPSMQFADGNLRNIGDGILNVHLSYGSTVAYETAPSDWIGSTQSGPIDGTSGDDDLVGGNGDDAISSGDGDDSVSLSGGNDSIDGGDGDDTVTFFGSVEGMELAQTGTGIRLTSASGLEGSATVSNVEHFYSITDDRTWTLAQLLGSISTTGDDVMIGTEEDDVLNALAGNDSITAYGGNDTLDGGSGVDTMIGGSGDDTYYVDDAGDVVTEAVDGGTDIVLTELISYTLAANVESLFGTAIGSQTLTGNSLNNMLSASGSAAMAGGAGDDTYFVDGTGDTVTENSNEGTDLVISSVSFTLGANVENLTLTGTANINGTGNTLSNVITGNSGNNVLTGGVAADTVYGGNGNDTLNGGANGDQLYGGAGNDIYYLDNTADLVFEVSGEGTSDQVRTSISFVLGSTHIEKLLLLGTAAINGTGNSLSNIIEGNSGNNVIDGVRGNDTLIGSGGADTFRFASTLGSTNVDTITDFTLGQDSIQLDQSYFTQLAIGALDASAFRSSGMVDADDRIIYDPTSGAIYYDADGSGATAAIMFATVTAGLALSASDFTVIA